MIGLQRMTCFLLLAMSLAGSAAAGDTIFVDGNAPPGGAVAFRALHKDGALQIEVEDTGIGIAPDELPKIYDKFFRSSDPRVREETGTGLGLSLAQEVIRLHGGKLHVQSELNKGTRFTVTLPAGGN